MTGLKEVALVRVEGQGIALVPFGQQRVNRVCGACQACCWRYPIHALNKPRNETCPEQCAAGCALHDQGDKPRECQRYRCLWLMGFGAAGDRPDKLGAIFDLPDKHHPRFLAIRISRTPGPLHRPARVKALGALLESYGNLLAFATDTEPDLLALGFDSVLGVGPDDGSDATIFARTIELHLIWRAVAEIMTRGEPVPFFPPRITQEDWRRARAERPDEELLAIARGRPLPLASGDDDD